MKAATLANWESKLRPLITKLPPQTVVSRYSKGRLDFLAKFSQDVPDESYSPPEHLSRELWGIRFRSPIMNSAGMFKNGECYEMVARQGAGGYIGGTGTWNIRKGLEQEGVYLPFVPYPRSGSASNKLALPNHGDEVNSARAANFSRISGTPVGWSLMESPDFQVEEKLRYLVHGMRLYALAGVDFIEINESCQNTGHCRPQEDDMANRLRYVRQNFLDQRTRRLPVIVKFSNDTEIQQLPELMDLLFEIGYDGVNFGNTSTAYSLRREKIHQEETKLFDYFTQTFGGGVSGRPLKESSLELAGRAVEYLKAGPPPQEFHVVRTGGISEWKDIEDSERAGISLNQWYTGYFEGFAQYGHGVYMQLFEGQE